MHTQSILEPPRSCLALRQRHQRGVLSNGIPLRWRRLSVPSHTAACMGPPGVRTTSNPDGEQKYLTHAAPIGVAGVVARPCTAALFSQTGSVCSFFPWSPEQQVQCGRTRQASYWATSASLASRVPTLKSAAQPCRQHQVCPAATSCSFTDPTQLIQCLSPGPRSSPCTRTDRGGAARALPRQSDLPTLRNCNLTVPAGPEFLHWGAITPTMLARARHARRDRRAHASFTSHSALSGRSAWPQSREPVTPNQALRVSARYRHLPLPWAGACDHGHPRIHVGLGRDSGSSPRVRPACHLAWPRTPM
ncbi:hypothetical protein NDU88_001995 [Pleurodeles waltl]|uniref:Uncharacterized protein n=1 Tax=Pleurodeles waltl TaxID=8319 RepID=A0AAV7U9Z9_PLEWA|nr:hypothetical protein NDU88_001995 [Pleurodeles waltl]